MPPPPDLTEHDRAGAWIPANLRDRVLDRGKEDLSEPGSPTFRRSRGSKSSRFAKSARSRGSLQAGASFPKDFVRVLPFDLAAPELPDTCARPLPPRSGLSPRHRLRSGSRGGTLASSGPRLLRETERLGFEIFLHCLRHDEPPAEIEDENIILISCPCPSKSIALKPASHAEAPRRVTEGPRPVSAHRLSKNAPEPNIDSRTSSSFNPRSCLSTLATS